MKCGNCEHEASEADQFCRQCGCALTPGAGTALPSDPVGLVPSGELRRQPRSWVIVFGVLLCLTGFGIIVGAPILVTEMKHRQAGIRPSNQGWLVAGGVYAGLFILAVIALAIALRTPPTPPAGKLLMVVPVGKHPGGVSVNPLTNRVYVNNTGDNTVSVIDGRTSKVLSTVPVGKAPSEIAVNPTTNRVYVCNEDEDSVSVIDGKTNTVLATLYIGKGLFTHNIAANPTTNKVYVEGSLDSNFNNMVSVIDGQANTILTTLNTGFGLNQHIAVNPITNRVYVTSGTSHHNRVMVIDGQSDSILTSVPVEKTPFGIAVNTSTNQVYVTQASLTDKINNKDMVCLLDGRTNVFFKAIPVGENPFEIAVNPVTNWIYVIHGNNALSIINGATNIVLKTLHVFKEIGGVSINTTTNRIYVSNWNDNTVSVLQGFDGRSAPPMDQAINVPRGGQMSINSKDGAALILIPAGEFLMGSTSEEITAAKQSLSDSLPEDIKKFLLDKFNAEGSPAHGLFGCLLYV